jgi:hypothetical protein
MKNLLRFLLAYSGLLNRCACGKRKSGDKQDIGGKLAIQRCANYAPPFSMPTGPGFRIRCPMTCQVCKDSHHLYVGLTKEQLQRAVKGLPLQEVIHGESV